MAQRQDPRFMFRTSPSGSRRKCLLLSEIFPPAVGGSGRWFWEIYRRLDPSQVVVAAGQHAEADSLAGQHDFPIERLPLSMTQWGLASGSALLSYMRLFQRLRRIIRLHDVNMIHSGRCLPEGWLAWLLKMVCGIPYCCYVHGEDVAAAGTSRELSMMVRRVLSGADALIANSRNTQNLLTSHWNMAPERVHVLYPGTDTRRFFPRDRSESSRPCASWNGKTVVLTVGRLQRRKGHDMLIRALPRIQEAIPDIHYAIVGAGDQRATLETLAAEHQVAARIEFLGEIPDSQMLQCYQSCDLFALPNRQDGEDIEGFGIVLLEAQACGKPVLSGASGGTAETMNPGVTGRVVSCDNPEPLADAIIQMLLDPVTCQQMGTAARQWVVDNFDWNTLCHRAAELFGISVAPDSLPRAVAGQIEASEANQSRPSVVDEAAVTSRVSS